MYSIAIQSGGASTRMGLDKGLMLFNGEPLAMRLYSRFAGTGADRFLISNKPADYAFLGAPVFTDDKPGRGALGGLFTALRHASQPLVGVIACDMPFANAGLLQSMAAIAQQEGADVVIPRLNGQYEPFHAVYRVQPCLAYVDEALEAGEWKVISWFHKAKLREVTQEEIRPFDPHGICFTNVNTQAEFALAERLEQNLPKTPAA